MIATPTHAVWDGEKSSSHHVRSSHLIHVLVLSNSGVVASLSCSYNLHRLLASHTSQNCESGLCENAAAARTVRAIAIHSPKELLFMWASVYGHIADTFTASRVCQVCGRRAVLSASNVQKHWSLEVNLHIVLYVLNGSSAISFGFCRDPITTIYLLPSAESPV